MNNDLKKINKLQPKSRRQKSKLQKVELVDRLIKISRVPKVTKGGKKLSFRQNIKVHHTVFSSISFNLSEPSPFLSSLDPKRSRSRCLVTRDYEATSPEELSLMVNEVSFEKRRPRRFIFWF